MARSFEIDLSRFIRDVNGAADVIARGAKRGMHDALDEWQAASVNLAPIDKRVLRDSIKANHDIEVDGLNMTGEITANTTERSRSGKRFNYAYYIHEQDAGGKNLRTPGTEKKFLDVALDRNEEKWVRDIEHEIETELKREGW